MSQLRCEYLHVKELKREGGEVKKVGEDGLKGTRDVFTYHQRPRFLACRKKQQVNFQARGDASNVALVLGITSAFPGY
jgi:hypothetical protein